MIQPIIYVKKCICESQHRFDLQVNRRALDWWKICDQTDEKLRFSQQNEKMKIEIRKDFVWRIWALKGLLAKKVSDIVKGLTSYPLEAVNFEILDVFDVRE